MKKKNARMSFHFWYSVTLQCSVQHELIIDRQIIYQKFSLLQYRKYQA